MAKNHQLLFCWKDILLYGETCYLIFRRGFETGKVVGGKWGVQGVRRMCRKNFSIWTRHSSSPRNFCQYSYLRPEFCILYSAVFILQSLICSLCCAVFTLQSLFCILCSAFFVLHYLFCILCSAVFNLHSLFCSV